MLDDLVDNLKTVVLRMNKNFMKFVIENPGVKHLWYQDYLVLLTA